MTSARNANISLPLKFFSKILRFSLLFPIQDSLKIVDGQFSRLQLQEKIRAIPFPFKILIVDVFCYSDP